MRYSFIIIFITLFTSRKLYSQVPDITGHYISIASKFEKSSELTLLQDSTFIYFYMIGGCQGSEKGKWITKGNKIILHTDITPGTVQYHIPNLNDIVWIIKKKGIRPVSAIDNGCFKEKGLHVKFKKRASEI